MTGHSPPARSAPLEGSAPACLPHLGRLVEWLTLRLPLADPDAGPLPPDLAAFPERTLVELVLLYRQLQRLPVHLSRQQCAAVDASMRYAAAVATRPSCRLRLATAPQLFPYFALLTVLLAEVGLPGTLTVAELQRLADRHEGRPLSPTASPLQQLELRYVLDRGGISHRLPPADQLAVCCLPKALSADRITGPEAYALTHALFYLTDFATAPRAHLDALDVGPLGQLLHELIGRFAAARDHDLTAELLLARHAVLPDSTPITSTAWHTLAAAQRRDGALPGPHFDPVVADGLPDDERRALYLFRSSAHTTVVTALAAASWSGTAA